MTQQIDQPAIAAPELARALARPRAVVVVAVLAFLQALLSVLSTSNVVVGLLAGADVGGAVGPAWFGVLAQVAGIVLLLVGAVKLLGGKSRTALVAGAVLEIAIILFYVISSWITGHLIPIDAAVSLSFAIIPVVVWVLARGASVSRYLEYRQAR